MKYNECEKRSLVYEHMPYNHWACNSELLCSRPNYWLSTFGTVTHVPWEGIEWLQSSQHIKITKPSSHNDNFLGSTKSVNPDTSFKCQGKIQLMSPIVQRNVLFHQQEKPLSKSDMSRDITGWEHDDKIINTCNHSWNIYILSFI